VALAACDKVLQGQDDLFKNQLGELVFSAMKRRAWIFLVERKYAEL
jgi:hypothetical protein